MAQGRAPDRMTEALLKQLENLLRAPNDKALEDLEFHLQHDTDDDLGMERFQVEPTPAAEAGPRLPILDDVAAPGPGLRQAQAIRDVPARAAPEPLMSVAPLVEWLVDARLIGMRETVKEAVLAELRINRPDLFN